jgi:multiple sugar transport system substrate-binding protein
MTTARRRWSGRTSVLLAVAALGFSAAGCGAGSQVQSKSLAKACDVDAPKSATNVNVLAYTAPAIDPFSNAMVACSSTSHLTVKHGPVDFNGQLTKADLTLSSKTPSYDVVEVYTTTLHQYADKGWIVPLDDLVSRYGSRFKLNDIDPGLLKQFTYKGKLYALPMEVNVHELVYRKDIFAKLGLSVPKTFDDLVADARKIQAAHVVRHPVTLPISASGSVASAYFNSLKSLGGSLTASGSNAPQLNTPAARTALESLKRLTPYMSPSAVNTDGAEVTTALQNGDAAIGMAYSGSMASLVDPAKSRHAADLAFAPPPSVAAGGSPWSTVMVDGFAVAKNSAVNQDLLFQIAATGTEASAAKAAGSLVYPARTSVLKDPATANSPKSAYWPAATQTLAGGASGPQPEPYFGALEKAVQPALASGVFGKASTDQALSRAQAAAEAFLKQNGYRK